MDNHVWRNLFFAAFFCTTGCDGASEQSGIHHQNPDAIRVLPLGDSITQADGDHHSYRYWLWQRLLESGQPFDFVGTQMAHHKSTPDLPPSFDRNHEGYWGWRADEILKKLPKWLTHYQSDIALVHLGTNDCLQSQPHQETIDELEQIAQLLRTHNPQIDIIFSPLGPTTWTGSDCLAKINLGLSSLVERLDVPESRVQLANAAEIDVKVHTYDGLHPNQQGEKLLADQWFSMLDGLLQLP